MSKAGGWVPLDKGLIKALPKDRPYTHLEAMFSYTVDQECENQWTIKGYAKLWSWSRCKVRKFIEDVKTPEGHSVDTPKTGKRHPVHYIDKGLWDTKDTGKTQERHGVDTPSTPTNNPLILNPKKDKDTSPKGSFLLVEEIFNYWKEKTGKKKAQLGGALKSKILGRIKDGYSVEDIKQAIDGNSGSAWHQGQNDKNTKYNGLDLICRDSTKIDYFMGMAQKPTEEDNVARWARIEANIGK